MKSEFMVPNFKGCNEYNPSSDPLKGLSKAEKDQFAFEYMAMWVHEEGFDDYGIMFDSGDAELLAHALVNSGAIDSTNCYESCKAIEQRIEKWATKFDSLHKKTQAKRYDDAFKDCMIIECKACNHTQFPAVGNFELYKDKLQADCWECGSNKIEIKRWAK